MTSSAAAQRHAWLELLQQSGPFLTVPVADEIWPAGLPAVPQPVRAGLRAAVTQLLDDSGASRAAIARHVFCDALRWGDALVEGPELPAMLTEVVAEHGVVLRPDFAFRTHDDLVLDDEGEDADELDDADEDEDGGAAEPAAAPAPVGPWRLLGMWAPWGTHPLRRTVQAGWAASPVERLAALLRARDVPLGLVSDGRWWALVWAPRGKPVGAAVFDASLWSEEPETLAAFVALLERRRFLGVPVREQLPALLKRSASAQEEVTTALGGQVRAAVEMLVRKLDELDRNAGGTLLTDVSDDELYAGVVTVMMRVVFLLFAEERRLLPSDDARYEAAYSVGRLVEQLEQRAAVHGEQTLEHRTGAWHRLLALTRALHGGVAHEDLRLPPYGGALFDPDRYAWLEGHDGTPPPVDDLTVLRMLDAVQYVRLYGERRRLSFRALDVEQIGYVYEGLLESEVRTATEPVLLLRPQRNGIDLIPASIAIEIVTDNLHGWVASAYVGKRTASAATRKRATRLLAEPVAPSVPMALHSVFEQQLAERLAEFGPLLRLDERDRPLLVPVGGRYVAPSTRRAATGAHYTPRSLAEEVVQHALEPLIYRPGPLETLERDTWVLRPSTELLALRVADIAMGSGAFLVAACRFLADRLMEAWDIEGDTEATRALMHRTIDTADAEVEGVLLRARRLVAEHCLYGVDVNPLAVEMAKLSLWLVTMDRERPFGFLDDRLVCGDSLLGISSMEQLEALHLDPVAGRRLHENTLDYGKGWHDMLAHAADARRRITATPVVTVRDVEHKARLLADAEAASGPLQVVADALTGAGLRAATQSPRQRDGIFRQLYAAVLDYDSSADPEVFRQFTGAVNAGLPSGKEPRRPLHWPLAFPEVFADVDQVGFDAIIGNPPFLGGKRISRPLGNDYLAWLTTWDGRGVKGNADLASRFLLRADALLGLRGQLGVVATNSVTEGDTLTVGVLQLEQRGWTMRRGVSSHPWPSASASLSIVELWESRAAVHASAVLDNEPVPRLGADLQPYLRETGRPRPLAENEGFAFQGHNVLGAGFMLTEDYALELIEQDPQNADVVFPYISGADISRRPDASASRWIINFREQSEAWARRYPGPWARVQQNVWPERSTKDAVKYPRMVNEWWKFWQYRQGLEEATKSLNYVLAISLTSSTVSPVRIPTGPTFDQTCVVFAFEDCASLAVLASGVHQAWVLRYGSTLETRVRYIHSNVFQTFPRPTLTPELLVAGEHLDRERRAIMLGRALGLTKLYNQVHDPSVTDPAIIRLRELHTQIDHAVLAAYGWNDLDPQIGHHPTKIGIRWTVSPEARFELLDRLLVENHRRAAQA
ncbi:Eco57I restriction-modification methylase domain-containing protein [Blastococcus mobilis]|uniref:site-specific DNA-methyltransferase (adenine-specific) n=1 Tax=Blastococcus mobilis TaxID=1938746 RepID=A0A238ZQR0_9ACTN|nr:type IIL restriction-modification enzyme MmeI [Blastococcus mobilis]SNR85786.1 hypothetical protein SAMN06272737_1327 [Blastococcus mobilis]